MNNTKTMSTQIEKPFTYLDAGFDANKAETAVKGIAHWLRGTLSSNVKVDFGFFANVVEIGNNLGLAISTDGVGTKVLVAQMLNRYDTIGIDCVAMNVNDVLCVGAKPLTMVNPLLARSLTICWAVSFP